MRKSTSINVRRQRSHLSPRVLIYLLLTVLVQELEDGKCRRLMPCFLQADMLLRALFSDPAVGFFPPFVVIMPFSGNPDPRGRVVYAHPSNMPSRSLLETFPMSCGSPRCGNTECGFLNLKATRALSAGTAMVRDDGWPPSRMLCNMWGCEKPHLPEKGEKLMQCQKCREVYYCSVSHQVRFAHFYAYNSTEADMPRTVA